MEELLQQLALKYPVVGYSLLGLGALVVVAQCVVLLTPSKKDDALMEKAKGLPVVGKLLEVLIEMAPIKKKK